jgi:hypothetical protein
MRPNAAFEINTASICTVAYLVIRPNASKANIALITGAGISNRVISKVRYGNISFTGAGASNVVERIGGDQGDVRFTGVGAYNKVSNSANRGSIYFEDSVGNTAAFKRNIPRITSAIYVITCCCTTKVNITCSSNMLQICCKCRAIFVLQALAHLMLWSV